MAWRIARALDTLLAQFNAKYPDRSKVSDGGIGDAAHATRDSDHNPWFQVAGQPVVTARDFTHDPAHGMDMNRISAELVATRDRRIKYVIWNRRILDTRPGNNPYVWMPYTGINAHQHHMHVSVMPDASCDDTTPWTLASFGATPPPQPEAQGMDVATLAAVMGNRAGVPYDRYLAPFIDGMIAAKCTTINRAAMWCAQLGTESGGLQWMRELASGAEYEGRTDLGNTQKGDGVRYAGRGPIQLTGRANYGAFSRWAAAQGYVSSPTHFVDNPVLLEEPRWGFLAASYYWTVARADINAYADKGDVVTVTRRINGGTNGLADRQARYTRALTFGARLLPTEDDMALVSQESWDSLNRDLRADLAHKQKQIDEQGQILRMIWEQLAGAGADPFDPDKMFPGWECHDGAERTLVDIGRRGLQQLDS